VVPSDRAQEPEVLSDVSNNAVVRMPGRRFPGLVIQGDSLSIKTSVSLKQRYGRPMARTRS
jgi:hypothetical protein